MKPVSGTVEQRGTNEMSIPTVLLVVAASLCLVQSQVSRRQPLPRARNMAVRNRMSFRGGYRVPARWNININRLRLALRRASARRRRTISPALRSLIRRLLGVRKRSITTMPTYMGAETLGCSFGMESDSIMRFYYPKGCTPAEDFCPFKYPGRRCVWSGGIGMCCPFYVDQGTIGASVSLARFKSLADMF